MRINSCSSSIELDAQYVQPHQIPKIIPAGRGHACCLFCHAEMQKVGAAATKIEFLVVQGGFTVAEVHLPRFSRDNRTSGTT